MLLKNTLYYMHYNKSSDAYEPTVQVAQVGSKTVDSDMIQAYCISPPLRTRSATPTYHHASHTNFMPSHTSLILYIPVI